MCGFLGSISSDLIPQDLFINCNKRIECRGPDEKVFSINKKLGTTDFVQNLAFNRLSIIDLSSEASQPMYSEKFNSLIMFNGEIFNHKELRVFLEKKNIKFKSSHSDTEVLLNGLSFYGINFLNKINGQFAIYFVDLNKNIIYLIRDRSGQKPLYFSFTKKNLYFGSDLQSVKKLSNNFSIDNYQLINYLNFGTTISPNTFYENISTVLPGEYVKIRFETNELISEKIKYWEINSFINNKKFIRDEFFELFENSVDIRLESDVPVSNFLSGGLDSTSIIKAVSRNSKNINTFSMITDSSSYNESKFMEQVVKKYKTNHKVETVSSNIELNEIKKIINLYDEIIYDPSIIPSYILSNRISKNFKVALSGDGGDELLSGYSHYSNYFNNYRISDDLIKFIFKTYPAFFGTGNKIVKYSNDWKNSFSSYFSDEKLLKILKIYNFQSFKQIYLENKKDSWKSLSLTDHDFFLSEMMLKKIDKSSMLNSLEVRSPFLDYRLFEYILSHNHYSENSKFMPKKILQDYLLDDFGNNFVRRKKMGFSINIKSIINKNKEEILDTIYYSKLNNLFELNNIKNLLIIDTKINSLRIWKLYCLSLYINK